MSRRFKRLGLIGKKQKSAMAGEIEEISGVVKAIVNKESAREEQEKIVNSQMTKTYLKELRSGQGTEAKLFYDYYGLWLINKRVLDLTAQV